MLIDLPNRNQLEEFLTEDQMKIAEKFWKGLWAVYVRNKGTTSSTHWMEMMGDARAFNGLLITIKDYIVSKVLPNKNWAEVCLNEQTLLTYFDVQTLTEYRKDAKYDDYVPTFAEDTTANKVRLCGEVQETGLVREGFALASTTQYYYDVVTLREYIDGVTRNTNKGMTKMREQYKFPMDEASYDNIATDIVRMLAEEPQLFTQEGHISDSRGRSIKKSLRKVGNPIGYKDFRALICIPEPEDKSEIIPMDETAIEAVYMFIGELLGYRIGTVSGKIEFGKEAHKARKLPELDDETLHEVIWLERLYNELDSLALHKLTVGSHEGYHWSVPIELDASASMLGYIGALLGDKRLLEMVNMAGPQDQLNDPWHIEGLPRKHVKTVFTPRLYGSSQLARVLWDNKKLEYTPEMLTHINGIMRSGAFGVADAFKEFVIGHCNPKAEMKIRIWEDTFTIKCNHYKNLGDVHVSYDIYDSLTGSVRRITHTKTKAVPDLERFRTYFQTLLVHNLDSQVANRVAEAVMEEFKFCIDVHDAFIVSPVAAKFVRAKYAQEMDDLHSHREYILQDYFRSIGITGAALGAWDRVTKMVEPIGEFTCRGVVLK